MSDPHRYQESEPGTARRWVRIAVIAAIVVAVLAVVMLAMGGGGHTPPAH